MMKKLLLCLVLVLQLTVSAVFAAGGDVSIEASEPAYSATGFTTEVTVRFFDGTLYHEDVLLSYHILSESGEMLVSENPRYPLSPDQNGTACSVLEVNLSELPELDGVDRVLIQFDLVDQKNAFWFSTDPDVDFQTVQLSADAEKLTQAPAVSSETSPTDVPASERFPVFSLILCASCWVGVAAAVLFWKKKQKKQLGGNS